MSKLRWGPFSVVGWDAFGSWSNEPLGLNGETGAGTLAQGNGVVFPSNTVGYHISTSMGARWRWGTGFIGLQYAPSIDYQTATDIRQVNWQNLSLFIDHPFQVGKWRLSMGVRSAESYFYSEFYNPPPLETLLQFQVPVTNIDLVGLLNEPEPLQPLTPSQLFVGTRFYTGNASVALARQFTGRDSLSVNLTAQMNHVLDFGGGQSGALFPFPQSSGGIVGLSWTHTMSSRQSWSVSLTHSQAFGGGIAAIAGQQQSLQFSYSWTPWRKWSFTLGGGPARFSQPAVGTSMTSAGRASVSYAFAGSVLTAGYTKGFQLTGFAGGEQSQGVNINWSAPQPRGHKWRYTLTGGYQLAQSAYGFDGQSAYTTGAGFVVNASFSYPVTRSLIYSASYGYFFQNFNTPGVVSGPQNVLDHFQRHLVSMGFHYSFGMQGAGGGMPGMTRGMQGTTGY